MWQLSELQLPLNAEDGARGRYCRWRSRQRVPPYICRLYVERVHNVHDYGMYAHRMHFIRARIADTKIAVLTMSSGTDTESNVPITTRVLRSIGAVAILII